MFNLLAAKPLWLLIAQSQSLKCSWVITLIARRVCCHSPHSLTLMAKLIMVMKSSQQATFHFLLYCPLAQVAQAQLYHIEQQKTAIYKSYKRHHHVQVDNQGGCLICFCRHREVITGQQPGSQFSKNLFHFKKFLLIPKYFQAMLKSHSGFSAIDFKMDLPC